MNKLLYYQSYEAHIKVYDEMRELDYENQMRQLEEARMVRQMEAMGLTNSDINDRLMHIKKNQSMQDINKIADEKNKIILANEQKQRKKDVDNFLNDILSESSKNIDKNKIKEDILNELLSKIIKNQRPTSINTQQEEEVEGKPSPTQTIATEATSSNSPKETIEEKQQNYTRVKSVILKAIKAKYSDNKKKLESEIKNFNDIFNKENKKVNTIENLKKWAEEQGLDYMP